MRFHEKSCQICAAQCNFRNWFQIFRENRLTFLIWRNFEPKFVLPLVSSKSVSYEQGLVYGYMGVRKLHSGQCCRILGYSVSLSLVTSSGFEAIETIRKLEAESKLLFFLTKMDSFEFWLRRMENKLDRNTNRPKTREEACDLLEITKVNNVFLIIWKWKIAKWFFFFQIS